MLTRKGSNFQNGWNRLLNELTMNNQFYRAGKFLLSALNICWKLGVVTLGVGIIILVVFIAKEIQKDNLRGGEQLSAYVKVYTKDGYKSLYNERETEFTLERLDWVSHGVGEDRIGVYSKNLRRGFYNYDTGEPLADAIYDKAWNFSEGLGAVESNGMLGFVDRDMKMVIPQKFHIVRASDDWPDAIRFQDGQCVLRLTPDSVGVIDKSGQWRIPPVYQSISELTSDSCRVVEKNGQFGIIDYVGQLIFEPQYDAVRITNPSVAVVAKDGYQKKITYSGTVLLSFVFDDVQEFSTENPLYLQYEVNGCRGVLDKRTGKPVIPAIYENVECLSQNRFLVGLKDTEIPLNCTRDISYIILDSQNRKISEQ